MSFDDNRLDRRTLVKGGVALTLASFAGCLGDDDTDDDDSEEPVGDDTVQMDGFEVPAEHVLPEDDIENAEARLMGERPLMAQPEGDDPNQFQAAQIFAENMSRLGFEIPIDSMVLNTIFDVAFVNREPIEGDDWWFWSMWRFAPRPTRLDPDELLYDSHSSQQDGYNWDYWNDDEYDEVVVQQRQAVDEDERREAVYECQRIMNERGPRNMLLFPEIALPYNSRKWEGVTNVNGLGPANALSFSNMRPTTDDNVLVTADAVDRGFVAITPFGFGNELDMRVSRMVWDRLLWIDADGTSFVNRLATDIQELDDTTYEIDLREGHEFHDGMEVLAEDVKFSYDVQNPGNDYTTNFGDGMAPVQSIEVTDDYRLELTTEAPFAAIYLSLFSRNPIAQKNRWEEIMEDDHFQNRTDPMSHYNPPDGERIGSGPMEFDRWDTDTDEVHLSRYDNHFDPLEYEARIQTSVPGLEQGLIELADGDIDMLTEVPGDPRAMYQIADDEEDITIEESISCVPEWITLNNDHPPLHLDSFRRAAFHGWDSEEILEEIYNGRGEVGNHSMISPALDLWYNDDLEPYAGDLQAAANELVDGGFVWDEDGNLYVPEGEHCLTPGEDTIVYERDGFNRDFVLCD